MTPPLLQLSIALPGFLWLGSGVGALELRAWRSLDLSLAERAAFAMALGLGTLAYAVFAVGLLGGLRPPVLAALVGLFALAAAWQTPCWWRQVVEAGRRSRRPSAADWVIMAALVGWLALIAVAAAAPPASMDWDGLSYHLAVPKVYLAAGRIHFVPYDHHSNFPFTVEMLFLLGLAAGSTAVAKAAHLALGLLAALATAGAWGRCRRLGVGGADGSGERRPSGGDARRPMDRREAGGNTGRGVSGWVPAALLLTAPAVLWESTVAYIDLAEMLFVALAMLGVLAWSEEGEAGWLTLAGAAAGFALGTKATALIPLGLLSLWVVIKALRASGSQTPSALRPSPVNPSPTRASVRLERTQPLTASPIRSASHALARLLVPAILIGAPWYVKSFLQTGNPVYPFFFGGINWDAETAHLYALEQAGFGLGKDPAHFLLAPWNLAFRPEAFVAGMGAYGSLGFFAAGLLPLLAFLGPLPRWARAVSLWSLGFLVIWFAQSQQSRYLLPLLPVAALLATLAVERIAVSNMGRIAAAAFIGFCMAWGLWLAWGLASPALAVATGAQPAPEYLTRHLDEYETIAWANANLPSTARVLLFDETRGFYLDRPYFWANPGHSTLIPWHSFHSPEAMVAWFKAHGFTHALVNLGLATRRPHYGEHGWELLLVQAMRGRGFQALYAAHGVALFAIP